jgi:hypothetical protein
LATGLLDWACGSLLSSVVQRSGRAGGWKIAVQQRSTSSRGSW